MRGVCVEVKPKPMQEKTFRILNPPSPPLQGYIESVQVPHRGLLNAPFELKTSTFTWAYASIVTMLVSKPCHNDPSPSHSHEDWQPSFCACTAP